jgi:hypothetical protein
MAFNYSPKTITNGLVLYLDASNPKSYVSGSSTWIDLGRNNKNATINPTYVTYDSSNGGVLQFSGNGTIAQGGSITGSAQYLSSANTVEFTWYAPTLSSGQILSNPDYSYGESGAVYDKNGANPNSVSLGWATNVWNYTTVTFNGSTTTTTYKNAVLVTSRSTMDWSGLTGNLPLGARSWAPYTQNFKLGFIKIYNRVLSTTEISQNFNAVRTRFGL